jgi:hypothetical protein
VPETSSTSAWPPELALGAHLARHARDLGRERAQPVDHLVDRVRERGHLALRLDRDLLRQVAVRHRGRHLRDRAHLVGQVRGHEVHRLGQVAPRARHALHLGLAAEDALGAHLARHARDLVRERGQLVDHGVHGLLQLRDLALHVHGDLLRQVALGHGGRDLGDVAHLVGEVRGHQVHRVGEVLPGAATFGTSA